MEDGPDVEVDESAGAGISKQVNKVWAKITCAKLCHVWDSVTCHQATHVGLRQALFSQGTYDGGETKADLRRK